MESQGNKVMKMIVSFDLTRLQYFLKTAFCISGIMTGGDVFAEILLKEPSPDGVVSLLPENQKKIMQLEKPEDRRVELERDKKLKKFYFSPNAAWSRSKPVRFSWECSAGEKGPFLITISESPHFSNPAVFFAQDKSIDLTMGNFKVGTRYFWKIRGYDQTGPGKRKKVESAPSSFMTEDLPPRWISEKSMRHVRDIGGYRTEDGKRVRQGLAFRGQGLNLNSIDGEIPGETWLTLRSVEELTKRQGIRTDLDLRTLREAGNTTTSPLGGSIRYIRNGDAAGAPHYSQIFTPAGMKAMAANFRVFCDRDNYPVYFHCVGGADRTGSLAFVLCGILGVTEKDLATGWEHRFYPNLPEDSPGNWRCYRHLTNGMLKYGKKGDPLKKRIELYLLDCGVKPEEIVKFRSIMLEP